MLFTEDENYDHVKGKRNFFIAYLPLYSPEMGI